MLHTHHAWAHGHGWGWEILAYKYHTHVYPTQRKEVGQRQREAEMQSSDQGTSEAQVRLCDPRQRHPLRPPTGKMEIKKKKFLPPG